jgi:epoxyqueuosine reductase
MLGDWIFGCDVCQEVCPFNHAALKNYRSKMLVGIGSGADSQARILHSQLHEQRSGPFLELHSVLNLRTPDQYLTRFAGTPLMRAGREGLLRNACCVAANTGEVGLIEFLLECLEHDDSALVRQHAAWAFAELSKLQGNELAGRSLLENHLRKEEDQRVRDEIFGLLGGG